MPEVSTSAKARKNYPIQRLISWYWGSLECKYSNCGVMCFLMVDGWRELRGGIFEEIEGRTAES